MAEDVNEVTPAGQKQRWYRRIDPGFLVVLVICFVALLPFLAYPDLPRETDAELHVYRLAELSRLVRGGEFYPRWSPHFYYGYGYPIYNYYAPLTYYIGLLVELWPMFGAPLAVKFVFMLGLVLAGLGMYGFVRDSMNNGLPGSGQWGRPAGYVAAAVYVYAPYIQYVDPHARGDLAESFSFGLFPLALWALLRLARSGRAAPWLAACLAVAAVILSHNLMAMVFFSLLAAWVLWQYVAGRRYSAINWDTGSKYLLPTALLAGVGLAAFFWLPVALEQEAVNLSSLIGDGSHFDFRNHFLSLGTLLGFSQRLDWGATEQAFTFNLGVMQWLLGLVGAVMVLAGRVQNRVQGLFFVLAGGLLVLMMTAAATPLWEMIPLLPYLQFPWRLLGPAVAMLAVLAGYGTAGLLSIGAPASAATSLPAGRDSAELAERQGWRRSVLPAGLVGLVLLFALPMSQIPPWEPFGPTGRREIVDIELTGRWLGTTSTADFVPATVDVLPLPNDAVLWNFWTGEPLERVNRATIPQNATVEGGELSPLHFQYQVNAPDSFLLRFFVFAFPGWEVRVDGEPVETELGLPEGFLVVPVPAGSYTVDLEFVDTPPRRLAWLISAVSTVGTVAVAFWLRRSGTGRAGIPTLYPPRMAVADWTVAGTALALSLALVLVLNPAGWLRYESGNYTAKPADEQTFADFQEQIALIGFDAPDEVEPGETFEVTLYWQAQRPLNINYQVFAHLLLPDGRTLVAQSDKLNPAGFPTKRWPVDQYVRDVHRLTIPEDTPAGEYLLSTGFWVQTEGWRLPLYDENGEQIGDNFILKTITVE